MGLVSVRDSVLFCFVTDLAFCPSSGQELGLRRESCSAAAAAACGCCC